MCMTIWYRAGDAAGTVLLVAGPGSAVPAAAAAAAPAAAQRAPAAARLGRTAQSPMAATNNKVDVLAYVGGAVYAGGDFTTMSFHGRTYRRRHLGAVSAATGAPTSFSPRVNGTVMSLAPSPDGKVLYVGGKFTMVGKHPRLNVAAFDVATGKLTSFAPSVIAGSVRAIADGAKLVSLPVAT